MKKHNHLNLEQNVELNLLINCIEHITKTIKLKMIMLKSSLCGYSDACIFVKETITVAQLQTLQLGT